ncbi:bifunctional glycosyltransferase/CDP-glycerol:glycerophosphate glycerophosphotransferase [Leuconostoc fallax]|uniref:Glycosyltransferase 2-like domain-containing protein n=1 Tax=Leuconostoc fallax TaxID=1251 RepID=A0A4R5N8X0_9LACO|nr:CDP-glycerol glycerophosphotransferase family protein [Leuconostoc fallax]MBU7455804.1 CDP-glycerol glycerophosphotransferase family protein [Leuconostoc fallax]TDG67954.1 hypothetical protein C5L23_000260 [Leuconostoc fallax]
MLEVQKDKLPKVTAIVAAYNVEYYIEETLDSLVNQTYPNLEILVIDDGSSDDTLNLVNYYASKYSQIKVMTQQNSGIARTRNKGIMVANGKYITFVDGDDVVPKNAYEKMVESLLISDSDMVSGFVKHINSTHTYPAGMFKVAIKDTVRQTNIRQHPELVYETTVWNKMYRRDFLIDHNIFFPEDRAFAEDIPFTMMAHMTARTVDIISNTVYFWRIRDRGDVSATQDRANLDFFDQRIEMLLLARNIILSKSETDNVLKSFDFKLFDHDLNIYLQMFENRSESFLLKFHQRIVRLVRQVGEASIKTMPLNKQIYYFAFFNADFTTYRRYINRRLDQTPLELVKGHLQIKDSALSKDILSQISLYNALLPHYLLTDVYFDEESSNAVIKGEWFLEGFQDITPNSEEIHARIVNIDNHQSVDVEIIRGKRYERKGLRYIKRFDPFTINLDYQKIAHVISSGRWKIKLTNRIGEATCEEFVGNPLSAKTQKFSKIEEASRISSSFNHSWELVLNVADKVDIQNEKDKILISVDAIQYNHQNIRIVFSTNKTVSLLKIISRKSNDISELEKLDDNQYVWETTVNDADMTFDHISNFSIESDNNKTLLLSRTDVSVTEQNEILTLSSTVNNHFNLLLNTNKLLVDNGYFKKNKLYLQLHDVVNVKNVVAVNSDEEVTLPIQQNHHNIIVQLDTSNGDYVLQNMNYDLYLKDAQSKMYVLHLDNVMIDFTKEHRYKHQRHVIWRSRMGTLRIKSNIIWHLFWDKTPRRRKFTEWVLYPLMRLLPLKKNIWVFDSYWSSKFSSNEKAIYEYIQENHPEIKNIWIFNDPNVPITGNGKKVRKGSIEYWWYMARAKYLVQNTNFPQNYVKRVGQIEIETLHGTFMKTMGFDEPNFRFASRWTQERFAQRNERWDYLVSPSKFMDKVAPEAFRYQHKVLHTGFPRNDQLIKNNNPSSIGKLKHKLSLPLNKEIVLYAPTYRQTNGFDFQIDLDEYVKNLGDKQILLVRLHYFIASQLDLSQYAGQVIDMSSYPEIEDLYLVSDILITDYSSVMFDYAMLHRPMVFYAYDLEWYTNPKNRGTYLDYVDTVPGPIVKTNQELMEVLSDTTRLKQFDRQRLQKFYEEFTTYGQTGNAAQEVVEQVLNGDIEPSSQVYNQHAFRDAIWKLLQVKKPFITLLNYWSKKLKRDEKLVIFSSFGGTQTSDSPKAIFDMMKAKFPDYKLLWLAKDNQYQSLFKKEGFKTLSMEQYRSIRLLSKAKYWVINDDFLSGWQPPQDIVVLQTGQGTSQKLIGADIKKVISAGKTRNNYVKEILANASQWTYTLSNSTFASQQKISGYQLEEHQVFATGYPKNDVLIREKDNTNYQKQLRRQFNIDDSKTVFLYEPTWRDDDAIRHGHYQAKVRFDIEDLQRKFGDRIQLVVKWSHTFDELPDLSQYHDFVIDLSSEQDTTKLYLLSDVLITDYSAGIFDFALLNRPILRYTPDFSSVSNNSGLIDDNLLPTKLMTYDSLCDAIDLVISKDTHDFLPTREMKDKYLTWDTGRATENAIDLLLGRLSNSWVEEESDNKLKRVKIIDGAVQWSWNTSDFCVQGNFNSSNNDLYDVIKTKVQVSEMNHQILSGPYLLVRLPNQDNKWVLLEETYDMN